MTTPNQTEITNIKCSRLQYNHCKYRCKAYPGHHCGCESIIDFSSVEKLLRQEQWDNQNRYILQIANNVKNMKAALVLGAGVSIPAGMPNWVGLVSKMLGYSMQYDRVGSLFGNESENIDENKRKTILSKELISGKLKFLRGINTLESAEYVSQTFDDVALPREIRDRLPDVSIKTMVRSMVNETKNPYLILAEYCVGHKDSPITKRLPQIIQEQIANNSIKDEDLLYEIQQLISQTDIHQSVASINTTFAVSYLLSCANGFRTAMTYNYDPLIQEQMIQLYGKDSRKIVTHPGKWNVGGEGETEIFHVHGYVPGDRHRMLSGTNSCLYGRVFPESSDHLILSEDSYYEIEKSGVYNWSSTVQSHFLNKYNCVFVGFSAEDYNFKRILKQLEPVSEKYPEARPWHYLILTIGDIIKQTYEDVCRYYVHRYSNAMPENTAEEIALDCKVLLQYTLACKEKYWNRYHIQPIWVDVKDIPELLLRLLP